MCPATGKNIAPPIGVFGLWAYSHLYLRAYTADIGPCQSQIPEGDTVTVTASVYGIKHLGVCTFKIKFYEKYERLVENFESR
jgi:hypothetical protein